MERKEKKRTIGCFEGWLSRLIGGALIFMLVGGEGYDQAGYSRSTSAAPLHSPEAHLLIHPSPNRLNSSAPHGVNCLHGDIECVGNIQQLCAAHIWQPKHSDGEVDKVKPWADWWDVSFLLRFLFWRDGKADYRNVSGAVCSMH